MRINILLWEWQAWGWGSHPTSRGILVSRKLHNFPYINCYFIFNIKGWLLNIIFVLFQIKLVVHIYLFVFNMDNLILNIMLMRLFKFFLNLSVLKFEINIFLKKSGSGKNFPATGIGDGERGSTPCPHPIPFTSVF